MAVTGAPLSVVVQMFFTTTSLAVLRDECIGLGLIFSFLTCALVQVKNYNFFSSRSWYIVPNARVLFSSPDWNQLPSGYSPTRIAHASSFVVIRVTVGLMSSKSLTSVKSRTYSSMVPRKFWNVKVSMRVLFVVVEFGFPI